MQFFLWVPWLILCYNSTCWFIILKLICRHCSLILSTMNFVLFFYFILLLFFRGLGGGGGGGSNCSFCFRFNSDIYKVGVRKLNDCCLFCGLLCCSYVCWKINVKQIGHGCCDMICYSNTVLQLDGKLHQIWFSTCMICHSDLIVTWHHVDMYTQCMICHPFTSTTITFLPLSVVLIQMRLCVCTCVYLHMCVWPWLHVHVIMSTLF